MDAEKRFNTLTQSSRDLSDLKGKSVRGGLWAIISEGSEMILRIVSISILARILVPEHFGLISMVTALTFIADRFKDLGLSSATIQKQNITHQQVSNLFWINTAVGIAMFLISVAMAYPISAFYQEPRLFWITIAIGSSFPFGGMAIQHHALLRREMKFAHIGAIKVSSSLLSTALAVILAIKGFEYWSLVAREVSRNGINAIGTWFLFPWAPSLPRRNSNTRSLLKFGAHLTGFNLIWYLASSLDQILIGKFFGAVPLGFYRQGFQLVLAPINQLNYPINIVSEAALSRLQSDKEKFQSYYKTLVSLTSVLSMPLIAFLVVFAEEIVMFVLGPKWIDATIYFQLFGIASFIKPSLATTGSVMLCCGFSERIFWLGLASSLSLIALFLVCMPWGPEGIAFAQVLFIIILVGPLLYFSLKGTPIRVRDFVLPILKPALSSLMAGYLVFAFRESLSVENNILFLTLGLFLFMGLYLSLFCLLPGGWTQLKALYKHVSSSLPLPSFLKVKSVQFKHDY